MIKNNKLITFLITFVLIGATGCNTKTDTADNEDVKQELKLVDPNATKETKALFKNLDNTRHQHVLFGHQDALAYGVHWRNDEPGRSDVMEVTGSYPAVYGWEIGDIELGATENLDNVNFEEMKNWIREGYERGGVITISWHKNNPATGGDAWDVEGGHGAVQAILPEGELHEKFKSWLNILADFANNLVAYPGSESEHLIPVIFRPYHEHNGSWFWWGEDHCTPDEYNKLWQFTVEYLRDEKGVNNLLWAISPGSFEDKQEYLERYPGDDYVDILGFDDYGSVREPYDLDNLINQMHILVELAEERGKIPAITETGYETIPDPNWWTNTLLKAIDNDSLTRKMAWVLVWRNANEATDRQRHFYAPYPGHASAENFMEFRNHPLILFEDDLPNLYSLSKN